jgi:DNA-binding MarR family transcriptional regulator
MPETSGHAITVDDVQARVQALMQLNHFGPPAWASADLTFGQLRLLFILGRAGPVSIGQLAEKLRVTAATASELIDRMERRGMVSRRHRADDRRIVECEIADEGSRLLAQISGPRQQMTRRLLAVLTGDELADLDRLLQSIAERLAAATTDAQPLKETNA